ncbi:MAG: HAMP domain-containing protein, partial [Anaerolineales bacterium]|nr:HAMP domain-containing protein [Anaerolineales bacterium]
DQAMTAVLTRYEAEWVTTLSPEFSAILVRLGEQALQQQEADALIQFHQAYAVYAPQRDALLAGAAPAAAALDESLRAMESTLDALVRVNGRFAELSNEAAQTAITQARWRLLAAGLVIGLLAVGLAVWLARTIIEPLAIMAGALQNLGQGNLNRDIPQSIKDRIMARTDEIGRAGQGLGVTEVYLIEMAETATRIADGDLTITITPRGEKDELGRAFAQMITSLRTAVGQVAESARTVQVASGELAAVAGLAGDATRQITTTIQQVAHGTAQQTIGVTQTANSVEQMKRAIEGVAQGAQEQAVAVGQAASLTGQITAAIQQVGQTALAVSRDSAAAAAAARSGAQTVDGTIRGMETIKVKVGVSAAKVKEMGQRSDQIGAIVETIDDIASQTNLLALNAAIEAARAGEHGQGFAVVADEVRKLAERASAATKEIGGLIRGIQQTVGEAVAAMGEGATEVEQGAARAAAAGEALAAILTAADAVSAQAEATLQASQQMGQLSSALVGATDAVSAVVEENTAATEEMAAGSTEVARAIEKIANVSKENSTAVEAVSTAAQDMNLQVEQVTMSAQSLAGMAQALQQVVAQFQLSTAAALAPSQPSAGAARGMGRPAKGARAPEPVRRLAR